jgi:transglutaminase/protease-like cytokinesis protein 3
MSRYINLFIIIFLGISVNAHSQTQGRDFKAIDDYVTKLGALDSLNMGTISSMVTKPFTDKMDKARAIYDWIAYNISFDCKAGRTGNTQKNSPTEVLLYRKAIGIGYASLFQDMCSSANIRCLTADGYVKNTIEQIGESKPDINHSWALVQLGLSPDTWFYVDPAWGSGTTDADMKVFTKSFNGAYFFADKTIFNLQHYPDNEAWKLGSAPKNKKDFFNLPMVKGLAYELGLKKITPDEGNLKVKVNKSQQFSFVLDGKASISKVSLILGDKKRLKTKEMNFSFSNGILSFTYKFDEEGNYPVVVMVNGKEFLVYTVDVE